MGQREGQWKRKRVSESEREEEKRGEREKESQFVLFMHSLLHSCMCPDKGPNLQPWLTGMML